MDGVDDTLYNDIVIGLTVFSQFRSYSYSVPILFMLDKLDCRPLGSLLPSSLSSSIFLTFLVIFLACVEHG